MFLLYYFFIGSSNVFINKYTNKITNINAIINENTDTNIITTDTNIIKVSEGYDNRYNQTLEKEKEKEKEKLYHIEISFKRMALLKTLEHPTISIIEKLDKIKYYSFLFNETIKSNMKIDTREGGLYNDWDFEM
uniref:Uncharacterized protein n=1 Tax=viral metagenome TaxID=1070528 RepID=A0A6C0LH59_9ZZZZ